MFCVNKPPACPPQSHGHSAMPPELAAHKGKVLALLCVAGELLIAAATAGRCLDVVIMSAPRRGAFERLLNVAAGLAGLRSRLQLDANPAATRRQKRLHFAHSFASLLRLTGTAEFDAVPYFSLSTEVLTRLHSGSANSVAASRRRICYVLVSVRRDRPILTLAAGDRGGVLRWYSPVDQLRWALEFSRKAQARGDVVFLLLAGQTRPLCAKTAPREGGSAALLLSTLFLVCLWTFRPFLALCAAICWGWTVQRPAHRVLQRPPQR